MHRMPARLRLLHWRSATRAVCLTACRMMNFMMMHAAWGIQGQTLPKPFLSVWKSPLKVPSKNRFNFPKQRVLEARLCVAIFFVHDFGSIFVCRSPNRCTPATDFKTAKVLSTSIGLLVFMLFFQAAVATCMLV
jgi:hypothetical protein